MWGNAALYSCYHGKVHITVTLYRFRTRLGSGTGFKSLRYFFLSQGQCLPEGDSMSQFCNLRNNAQSMVSKKPRLALLIVSWKAWTFLSTFVFVVLWLVLVLLLLNTELGCRKQIKEQHMHWMTPYSPRVCMSPQPSASAGKG